MCSAEELEGIAGFASNCPELTTEETTAATTAVAEALTAADASEPIVEIAAQVAFPIDIEAIAEGSDARTTFETDFKAQMAASIGGVPADKVFIDAITGARRRRAEMTDESRRVLQSSSVSVDFHIVAPASVQSQAAQLVAAVDTSTVAITVGGVAVAASSISAPVVTVPDDDCVGAYSTCAADCTDATYVITTAQSGAGTACTAEAGATQACAAGDGDCPEVASVAAPPPPAGSGASTAMATAGVVALALAMQL
jgi:hypothetical protein